MKIGIFASCSSPSDKWAKNFKKNNDNNNTIYTIIKKKKKKNDSLQFDYNNFFFI